jgi:hypothetical protein
MKRVRQIVLVADLGLHAELVEPVEPGRER